MSDEGAAEKRETGPGEYAGERDMDRFWRVAASVKEPVRRRWYVPAILLLVVASVPWYRAPGVIGELIGGLPGWVWISLLCTVGVSALTAVGALYLWRDDSEEEPPDDA
jgi:hypothetical protein